MEHRKFISPNGSTVTVPVPHSYADTLTLIKSDRFRIMGRIPSIGRLLLSAILRPSSHPLVWLRLCAYRGALYYPAKMVYDHVMRRRNIDIPPQTRIGYGFYIGHGIDIVINGGTVIGNNVNISQFLNIGTNHSTPSYICDNVYLGPMVCIVEDVTIGEGATIGAGAVVTRDIPASATAVGVPASAINTSSPARYITNPYPIP